MLQSIEQARLTGVSLISIRLSVGQGLKTDFHRWLFPYSQTRPRGERIRGMFRWRARECARCLGDA
jgi:hypothetical protein